MSGKTLIWCLKTDLTSQSTQWKEQNQVFVNSLEKKDTFVFELRFIYAGDGTIILYEFMDHHFYWWSQHSLVFGCLSLLILPELQSLSLHCYH